MKFLLRAILWIIKWVLIIALPFFTLVRGAVWAYHSWDWPTWAALLGGAVAAFIVLWVYLIIVYVAVFGIKKLSEGSMKAKTAIAAIALALYCTFTLVNISSQNAKTGEVRKEFRSLHPIMRMGVGTFVLFDRSMLITDMSRTHGDYNRMGLKVNPRTLHYKQSTGYVHAMDLRTIGRPEWRNWLTNGYFRLMGFRTLRHVGTADHLHVSLAPRDRKGSL
ncbi:MAG: hypothetical protein AB8F95_01185 [Bacteroidia bacterium]